MMNAEWNEWKIEVNNLKIGRLRQFTMYKDKIIKRRNEVASPIKSKKTLRPSKFKISNKRETNGDGKIIDSNVRKLRRKTT